MRVLRVTRNKFRIIRGMAQTVDNAARAAVAALENKVDDTRRLVAALNWDVNPSQISGRTAAHFERTFRAQFDTPYIDLTHLYFEAWIADPAGAAQMLHDRAQWKQVTHLDIAVDSIEAVNIVDTLQSDHDHVDVEFRFFDDAVSLATRAVTSARVLIVEGGGQTGGGTVDNAARAAAAAAGKLARDNQNDIAALEALRHPATLSVWPPNVAQHSGFQRSFKAVLNELDEQVLRIDGGSTGTRFVNRFQIKTRNADRAEVVLHNQAWSFTEEGAQELEWAVDAAEFNRLGTSVSTDYIEVWGEFRALYGGGVDELRGRTNTFVIGFGEESDWPATRGDVSTIDARLKTAEADIAALEAGELTTVGKIALLSLTSEPSAVAFRTQAELETALRRTTIGISNPELLDGDVWVEGQISGQPALARVKWSSATAALNLDLSAGNAVSVANNVASDRSYPADLVFFAQAIGGAELERLRVRIPLTDLKDVASLNARSPRAIGVVAYSATPTIDWTKGKLRSMTLTGNTTLAFSNVTAGDVMVFRFIQDATGGRTLTLPAAVVSADGADIELSTGAGAIDVVTLLAYSASQIIAVIQKNVS